MNTRGKGGIDSPMNITGKGTWDTSEFTKRQKVHTKNLLLLQPCWYVSGYSQQVKEKLVKFQKPQPCEESK